ncbi:nucleotidyl transferase AbiEii/AbiGii toxin family protein, partial [Bifidobacterium longum]
MESNEPKRPNSFKRLKQLIDRQTIRLSDTAKAKTFRKNFIAGVLGQMIPDGAYLKGGSAISLRYPLSESRVSRDIDTAYSGSEEEFEESFAKKLQEGWQGFAGSFEHA